jgi:hypothetical protein
VGTPTASKTTCGPSPPDHARLGHDVVHAARIEHVCPREAAELQAAGDEVHEQHLRPAPAGGDAERLADRAGAEHDDALALGHAPAVDRVDGDRDRLHEGGDGGLEVADREELVDGQREVLCEGAVDVDADEREVRADVRAPDRAGVALAAAAQRPDRHALALLQVRRRVRSELLDDRRDLVTLDLGELRAVDGGGDDLAGEEVVVRAAEPDRLRAQERLARIWLAGVGNVRHLHDVRLLRDGCPHLLAPPRRSGGGEPTGCAAVSGRRGR